jgi:hypothetical protein
MDGIADSFQETSTENWGSRLKDSCACMCIGFLLFFCAFPLLFWNEGRAVDRYDTLDEGAAQTVSISAISIDPANEGKLVHLTADITSSGLNLTDPLFGVSTKDLLFAREVEMYQWRETESTETRSKTGGTKETITTYSYRKDWSSSLERSNSFHEPTNHENPASFPFDSLSLRQDQIFAGQFELPDEVISKINWFAPLSYDWDESEISDSSIQNRTEILRNGEGYYVENTFTTNQTTNQATQSEPTVGDTQITFSSVKPRTISVIAQQRGSSLQRWEAEESDGFILLFNEGNKTVDQLFAAAEAENAATTWFLRLLGFLLMGLGIYLVLSPIVVFADVLPILGSIIGCGICAIAFIIAGFFSGLTISIAWLVHHPMIGGIIFLVFTVITCGALYLVKSCGQSNNGEGGGKEDQEGIDEEAPQQQDSPYENEEEIVAQAEKVVDIEAKTVEEVPFGFSPEPVRKY